MAEIKESTLKIPMRDGHDHQAIVYKLDNTNLSTETPLIVLIHGGGFSMGGPKELTAYSRALASLYNAAVVNIAHCKAPQYRFPIAANDVVDSLKWLGTNASSLIGADPAAGFIASGISSGANLAAVATHKSILEGWTPRITGLMVALPFMLHDDMVPDRYKPLYRSREENANAKILNAESVRRILDSYRPDIHSVDFSPLNIPDPAAALQLMPPVYMEVCGKDPLRDDGLIYEQFLREHVVKTKVDLHEELAHGEYVLGTSEVTWRANCDLLNGFGWLLGKTAMEKDIAKVFSQPALMRDDGIRVESGVDLKLPLPDDLVRPN
ncbi:hypothetical protein NECHADRAFT_6775 [Paecilomyces variotii No. 5]|uniref:Alpha/beta hydrolase fold-3 domain-containing protein n=1 Tax=Byssochlamys spectabilis (strain No. 5 / NBRC 109023) TaxID=1356009 RepID=V5G5Y3_BYSSN|nr:hypothetical protein NECHADRAFT_6775 [Paecilomyces variotii No. 5]